MTTTFKVGNRVTYGNTKNSDRKFGKIVATHETKTGVLYEIQPADTKAKNIKARAGLIEKA